MFEFVDKVVYINLDKRIDRRAHMETLTTIFGDKVIRFPAIEETPGYVGCTKSHIAVMKMALENNWKNVLVLEDDIAWNNFEEGYALFEKLANSEYDCILLGGTYVNYDKDTFRVKHAYTSAGYLINGSYIPTILNNFEEGLSLLLDTKCKEAYALDSYWMKLQAQDNWFIVMPSLVYQLPGYSDIVGNVVNYIPEYLHGVMNWA